MSARWWSAVDGAGAGACSRCSRLVVLLAAVRVLIPGVPVASLGLVVLVIRFDGGGGCGGGGGGGGGGKSRNSISCQEDDVTTAGTAVP